MKGAGGKFRHEILVGNREMVAPEEPEPFEHRRSAIQRGIMANAQFQIFEEPLACLISQLLFGRLIGLAIHLVFFAKHFSVGVNPMGIMVHQRIAAGNVPLPGQGRHRIHLRLRPGQRIIRHRIIQANAESDLS